MWLIILRRGLGIWDVNVRIVFISGEEVSLTWRCWPLRNICVTNDHGYVFFVVMTSQSFPRSWLITVFVTRITQRVSLVVQYQVTANSSGVHAFSPGFWWDCCCSICSFLLARVIYVWGWLTLILIKLDDLKIVNCKHKWTM